MTMNTQLVEDMNAAIGDAKPLHELMDFTYMFTTDGIYFYKGVARRLMSFRTIWPHFDYINLLNAFYIVLLMDITYKTNKYHLSLLE
ncbi:hypothetical protein L6164_005822 [Bauhinia variegata]|uniref:Uncharacterized protein n=1 Tax=Bauhinia variegata TaxID=167791 RepID=A0ACB9PSG3_BAUVA|nr:hypothetical protein L6164_005822 [Bauhinia variegata]